MATINIISGFLGAGKTTLIKKLLADAFPGEKLVLIENEFGEISVDGGFLKESGVQISEMSSGCICCSLVGDFHQALKDVYAQFSPDRILIEPSGVGKLSDVIAAAASTAAEVPGLELGSAVTVADAGKVKSYMKNFGEFYNDQIEAAGAILLSRTQNLTQEKVEEAVALLREKNGGCPILTTPWDDLSSAAILSAMEGASLSKELLAQVEHEHHHHHHDEENCPYCNHDHHDHEHHHDHGEHHHHDHDEHDHHHHDHDDHEHHHHDHDEHDHHHHDHDHHHHHHHDADEVFSSWGVETPRHIPEATVRAALAALDAGECGVVLRAKGIVDTGDGWVEFDFVPGEVQVRPCQPDYTGRLCVIGSGLQEDKLAALFGL